MSRNVSRQDRRSLYILLIIVLSLLLIVLCLLASRIAKQTPGSTGTTPPAPSTTVGGSTGITPGQTTAPTQPPVTNGPTQPPVPTIPPTQPPVPTVPPTQPPLPTVPPTQPPQPTVPTTQPTVPSDFDAEQFFAESAFIGDSVTLALRNYCLSNKQALHGATILCAGSYAVRHALAEPGGKLEGWDVVSITYQGEKMRPEDALAACGAKRVFIMLGLNDIALEGIDKTISNWGKLIKNIRAKCPDIEIYIQSGTPIQLGGEKGSLNNTNMDKYNGKLEQFCADNGCYFVNVASALKNAEGGLREDYCSDDYCHLTDSGVQAWIQYLKDYAAATHG